MAAIFNSPYRNIFILALFVFLITAYFSVGYYHLDEHFQILEFCNYMLGKSSASDLPWEFQQHIRPALQPALAWAIIKLVYFTGIKSPFAWALILRLISALLSWYIICKLCMQFIKEFSSELARKLFLFLSLFLWFIPFLSVRFSSENYAAIAFLIAIYLILRSEFTSPKNKYFYFGLVGLILGLSFFFRFQIAFSIIGLGAWLLFIKKQKWSHLFVLVFSAVLSIGLCIYLDYWLYGHFELSPLNYYNANITNHIAASWGVEPWWFYFESFIPLAIPPFSILMLLFFLIGIYLKPKHLLTWCIIPFLIGHFIVGHKEMRFMIPIIFEFIFLVAVGMDIFIESGKYLKIGRILFISFFALNAVLLIFRMLSPAQEAIKYYQYLYNFPHKKQMELFCLEKDIYKLSGVKVNFYRSKNVKPIVIINEFEFFNYLKFAKPDSVYYLEGALSDKIKYDGYLVESKYCILPKFVFKLNFNDWISRSRIWDIEELTKIK